MNLLLDVVIVCPRRSRFLCLKTHLSRNVSHGHILNTAIHHQGGIAGGSRSLADGGGWVYDAHKAL